MLKMPAAMAGAGLGVAGIVAAAPAQAQVASYNIQAGSLRGALDAWARQSGRQVIYRTDEMRGVRSPGARGPLSADAALRAILAGTGFSARADASGAVAIVRTAGGPSAEGEPDARGAAADSEYAEEENIVVTGTNIRGAPNRTVPTVSLDRDYIESTGYATTAALIESLPQNFALTSEGSRIVGISDANTQGSAINLRGLGEGTTLTLLNGRRLALGYLGSAADISGLSLSAVERVEILTDGASAVYGSDAIGGVVNFILRSDYDGAETRLRGGTAPGGIEEYRASQVVGTRWGSGNIVASGEYYHRDQLRATDRDFVPPSSQAGSLLPRVDLYSLMLSGRQALSGDVTAFTDVYYSQRDTFALTFTGQNESYRLDNAQLSATAGLDWQISESWQLELSGGYGRNDLSRRARSNRNGANGDLLNDVESDIAIVEAKANGTLLTLPGGALRTAIGASWRWEGLGSVSRFADSSANAGNPIDITQEVGSLFAELYVPVVGPGNRRPGIERLEISLAGRLDRYTRFGTSFDPRIGAMWEPVQGLRLRGSWGTSYAAPKLADYNSASIRGFALIQPDPGLGGTSPQLLLLGTAVEDLGPQESTSWTLGLDVAPRGVSGLRLEANYYDISFENRIALPPPATVMLGNPSSFADLIVRNPTPQQIADYIAIATSGGNPLLALTNPNNVVVIVDGRRRNLATTETNGIDLTATYAGTSGLNRFRFAATASYIFKLRNAVTPASVPFDAVGTIFNPTPLRIRASAGWSREGWSADLHANHVDSYVDNRVATAPVAISSWTTFDGRIAYEFGSGSGFLDGLSIALSAQNLFDEQPPRIPVIRTDFEAGYDPTNANPLGRLVALEISKRW